jgi:hypothetical protein
VTSCGGSPAAPSRSCRRWVFQFQENGGSVYTCSPDVLRPRCSDSRTSIEWSYAAVADFVREPQVKNRIRALTETRTGCGSFAYLGCTTTQTEYAYDGEGRLLTRRRTPASSLGGEGTPDVTTYLAWDRSLRPTRAVLEVEGEREEFSIAYDDALSTTTASNGEARGLDGNGNLVREVVKRGVGDHPTFEREIRVLSTQEVCES